MIFNSIKQTLKKMIFNPLVLLPMISITLIGSVLSTFLFSIIEKPLIDIITNFGTIQGSNLIFIVLTQYPIELILSALVGYLSMIILFIAVFSLARMAKNESIIASINDSIADFNKAMAVAFYAIIILFSATILLFIIGYIFEIIESIIIPLQGILTIFVFPIILFGGMILILTKTIFVIPIIIESNLKKSIQESWNFTKKRFWNVFFFIAILSIITILFGIIAEILTIILGAEMEELLIYIADIIASTFFILAISYYYYSN